MYVTRIVDAGVAHGQMHRSDRLFDLDRAADLFRQEVAGVGDADAEAFFARRSVRGVGHRAREHRQMRRREHLRCPPT